MMKKLLALLLALLLPVAALCETAAEQAFQAELMMTVNEEAAADRIVSLGLFAEEDEERLSASVAKLLNGVGLRLTAQEDAARLEMLLSGQVLLDFTAFMEEEIVLASDLMQPYGLVFSQEELAMEALQANQLLGDIDLVALTEGVAASAQNYLNSLESTTQRGSFAGDAFSGGVYCHTWMLDDADMAALVNALMTDDLRALLNAITEAAELSGMDIPGALDEMAGSLAAENACRYIIRYVTDEGSEPVGLSVTVMEGERQLCTLSVGFEEDALRLVFGFSQENVNYWHDHSIRRSASTGMMGMELESYSGEIREFTAGKDADYAYGRRVPEEEKLTASWKLDVVTHGGIQAMTFEGEQQIVGASRMGLKASGERNANGYGAVSATIIVEDVELVTLSASLTPCEPMDVDASALTLVDALDGDQAMMDALSNTLVTKLTTRLLTVIPFDLLMYLQ